MSRKLIISLLFALFSASVAFAQDFVIRAILVDPSTKEPIPFATASITKAGGKAAFKYVLSDQKGKVSITSIPAGSYVFKAELLGYQTIVKQVEVKASVNLGQLEMKVDNMQLDAAKVSATGNAIIMKKDTIEFTATAFKTTDNDVLEDLLKKLPGVEVAEDGSITVNGQTVKKITIDGKTFFLDDPQLASKNIPAKMVEKLKVIDKKSDQAAFTGIDDGEEETVIDLTVKKGMMKGAFGNVMLGGGHDLMPNTENGGDWRFQGAAFAGQFKDKSQISLVLNANNTNNRGFNDLSGSMMGNMRQGRGMGRGQGGWGGQNGITTSYMGGLNGAWTLLGDRMDLSGNYLFNFTEKDILERSTKTVFEDGGNFYKYKTKGNNNTISNGHRFGIRLEHKFSENTSILFEPRVEFGGGNFAEIDTTFTFRNGDTDEHLTSMARTGNSGNNSNVSTSGFFLLRQRLGIPGRTLTFMGRYSYSENRLGGFNKNGTDYFDGTAPVKVDQRYDNKQISSSLWGRLTYTEPLGRNFYVEANYSYGYNRSSNDKKTFDGVDYSQIVEEYTNNVVNEYVNQSIGANVLYQNDKVRAQLGFSAKPTKTHNTTAKGTLVNPVDTTYTVWNFAPQAMLGWDINKSSSLRMFYFGNSRQPSVSQLVPVLDNSNPLALNFGNPSLRPYFTHDLRGDYRFNNKKQFMSLNVRFGGGIEQDPIVNAIWYGQGGKQYTMPVNGPLAANANFRTFGNFPIAKSKFSISNFTRFNWTKASSYVLSDVDMNYYAPGDVMDYDLFLKDFAAGDKFGKKLNSTDNITLVERLRFNYRSDNLELQLNGRMRLNQSWYTVASSGADPLTFNNQVGATANWTWETTGITIKGEYNFNWYTGYSTPKDSEHIFNAEIQKLLFKKKFTIALKAYDILNQSKNISVTDAANYHLETVNNTLGRYIILSLTYRFGTFDRNKMRGPGMGGPRGRF